MKKMLGLQQARIGVLLKSKQKQAKASTNNRRSQVKITKEGLKNLIKEELADLLKQENRRRLTPIQKLALRNAIKPDPLRSAVATLTMKDAEKFVDVYNLEDSPMDFWEKYKDGNRYDIKMALERGEINETSIEEINRLDRDEHQREMQKSHEEKMRPQPEKLEKHYREKLEKHYRGMHARYGGRRQMDGEYIDSELPDPDALASLSLEELEGALEELEAREDAEAEMYQESKP